MARHGQGGELGDSKTLHPFQVILKQFEYLNASKIAETSLVEICLKSNCPNEQVAKQILNNMVQQGLLEREYDKDNGITFYKPAGT